MTAGTHSPPFKQEGREAAGARSVRPPTREDSNEREEASVSDVRTDDVIHHLS